MKTATLLSLFAAFLLLTTACNNDSSVAAQPPIAAPATVRAPEPAPALAQQPAATAPSPATAPKHRRRKQHAAGPRELFSAADIKHQEFSFNASRDTVLTGENGTQLEITSRMFVNKKGRIVTGPVKMELIEVLHPEDFVLTGLTTMSDGRLLESGGTLYVKATADGEELALAKGKSIRATVPKNKNWEGMQLFTGVETAVGVNWINPEPLTKKDFAVEVRKKKNPAVDKNAVAGAWQIVPSLTDSGWVKNQLFYFGDSLHHGDTLVRIVKGDTLIYDKQKLADWWAGKHQCNARWNYGPKQELYWSWKRNDNTWSTSGNWDTFNWFTDSEPVEGSNTFREDHDISSTFQLTHLGWANIDRLYSDPRTKQIDLVTKIDNWKDFDRVYISMVFTKQSMYLPGYQKKDKTFSFTHGDYEKTALPVGEEAWIIATAYKNDKAFFTIQKITISEKQDVQLTLEETTKEKMQEVLKERL